MCARPDRADDLFRLCRGEDELHVLRRFLDDLQQRVEALRGHHVRLVEDEDLVAVPGRREHGPLAQIPRVVDTVVACGIDLHDIHRSATIAAQLYATRADAAGGISRSLGAVEAASEDAGRRGLAATARPAEEIGVIDAVVSQRSAQRIGHLRLPDQLGKSLWPITAIQGGNHPPRLPAATDAAFGIRGGREASGRPRIRCALKRCGAIACLFFGSV